MNEYNTTAVLQDQDDVEIDLRDMLASLLLRWKAVIAWMLAAAILACGVAAFKNNGKTEIITEEDVAAARANLTDAKAEEAETFYFLYEEYAEQQKDLTSYYSKLSSAELNNTVIQMKNSYFIISSLDNLESVITKEILSEKEYRALRRVAPDDDFGARIYDRVDISTVSSSKVTVSSHPTAENQYLVTAIVYEMSESKCEKMMQILEESLEATIEKLKETDPKLSIVSAGSGFSYDTKDYVNSLIIKTTENLKYYETELIDLAAKISKTDSDEQSYYNQMKALDEQDLTEESRASLPKYAVIGAILGAVIAVVMILWPYLFDGKVKIEDELEATFGAAVLNRVWIPGKKTLFDKWCRKLCNADKTDPNVKVAMIAADLAILLEKYGKKSLYLFCKEDDMNAVTIANQVKERLAERTGAEITVGNPLATVEELEKVGAADIGVVFAELKQTRRNVLTEWGNICSRYQVPVAGEVAVQLCWR